VVQTSIQTGLIHPFRLQISMSQIDTCRVSHDEIRSIHMY